jgi:gamma-glutamyl-gamma-aminobutyrate hydrolase PuuD
MKPIILVTAGKQNPVTPRGEVQVITSGCDVDYIQSVVRAGGAPVILPCMADREAIGAAVAVADGVLLTGGGDIISLAYGEEPHLASKLRDPTRDEMELEVTRRALERELPVLGICRGVQVLNVALGGTLIQDVPSQVAGAVQHYSAGLDTVLLHTVAIEEDSLLARVMGTTSTAVNSWHHQAVKEVGRGLRVNCRARDGVIEGLESVDGRSILGVQFHPEECTAAYPQFRTLFDWLVHEAGVRAGRGS